MNELYPFKFKPQFKEKIWGGRHLKEFLNKPLPKNKKIGESWEISGVEENVSTVDNGFLQGNKLQELIEIYMGDLVGDRVYDQFGIEFPLLIKFIDANDVLSIQVHPDDELAKKRHNSFGKTEMWYIVEAEKDAELISGFKKKTDKNTYLKHLKSGKLPEILNYEKVHKGDVFFIPSGRVHAIGKGIVLAEIQQTSDITYRIFDWNRTDDQGNYRELHTDLALDAIDFNVYDNYKTPYKINPNKDANILNCKYFNTNIIQFNETIEKDYHLLDSFVIYMCLDGKLEIIYNETEKLSIEKGETILIPAVFEHLVLNPVDQSKLLEIYIPEPENEKSTQK
ncbi:MAG TPA: type I phosphomannose isomerase catalytic subunit [Bacteroidales bacterium]|nr:type I phosphomannose isomerase catalytic subunit [Bacteroidales bacterium]